ncbi:hypothetical protein Vadar_015478 [Vaccinium darrowii]|uniref:Uncharacterized protein n=1 Tax=Vaccinium darrowii TaxID=229202 RepID=A0ACB7ZBZ9_9ERIC|nr:hypothetical protein Vadar_015478 [Vaccinium darrowii]
MVKHGSKTQVAVKKLDKLSQGGEREFKAEVTAIGKTHHKNLVQLVSYCYEGPHRLLVYEFMSNGRLADFLFGIRRPDWYQRVQIALGIARGLIYLYEECSNPIIHCDVKPQTYSLTNCSYHEFLTSDWQNLYCSIKLEPIRGKSVAQEFEDEERVILADWAYDRFREGTIDALVDKDDAAVNDIETLIRWVIIAIWCIYTRGSVAKACHEYGHANA